MKMQMTVGMGVLVCVLAGCGPRDPVKQCNLGLKYTRGDGVETNYVDAVKWFRKAADQGLARAQCNLGIMCERGQGVATNYLDAVAWYRLAADQGFCTAQYNLGYMYEQGKGVATNYPDATAWYSEGSRSRICHGAMQSWSYVRQWKRRGNELC